MFMTKKDQLIAVFVSAVFVVAGCGTKFTVNHYPDFYEPSIKSVAVLPFVNETSHKGAGTAVADHLSAALAANGTYKVASPAMIDQTVKEKKLPALPRANDEAIAEQLAALGGYQAFIVGKVLSDTFTNTVNEYYEDYDFHYAASPYWYSSYWYPPYWYYPYYYDYGGQIYISVDVSMVSVPDGKVLSEKTIGAKADISGVSSAWKKYAVQMALSNLSRKIVSEYAIVPVKINVDPDKAMKTADTIEQDKWHFSRTFGSNQKTMYVVLYLPMAAAMNQFKLTIAPEKNPSNIIASKDFTWERGKYCQSVEFSPSQIAKSSGTGKYTVNLISRGEVIITKHIRIK
jgi:hypothetical protein